MKHILSIAVVLAVVGFISAQGPPLGTVQNCVPVANATGLCSAVWNYQYLNTTSLTTALAAAQAQFDANVAKFTNASAACREALTVFACQSNLARCGKYQTFNRVLKSRCDAVNTACGVTGFPTNFTGPACVANSLVTVEGAAAVCVNNVATTLGNSCASNIFDPEIVAPSPVQRVFCPAVSSCNTTGTTSTCVRPNNLGDACVSSCVTGTANPGSILTCVAGTCQYTGKRHDYTCINNAECLSGDCRSGKCFEQPLNGNCTVSTQCRMNLYCDTVNGTCVDVKLQGELCGFVQPNWSLVQCKAGFTCVRETNSTFSRCVANANIGQACQDATGGIVYDRPLCSPSTLPTTGIPRCVNNVCTAVSGGALGAGCNVTSPCNPQFTCQYPSGSNQGTCATPSTVVCDTAGGATCNQFQTCTCTDVAGSGTCNLDQSNPLYRCASQQLSLQQCLLNKCQTVMAAFVPYDGYSCGATQCLTEVNAYFCCVKGVVGTNYVAPNGQPTDPCITPSPTPGPTGPTTTTVPIQSSKRSGASSVVVSFVAMIIAVVAFCL